MISNCILFVITKCLINFMLQSSAEEFTGVVAVGSIPPNLPYISTCSRSCDILLYYESYYKVPGDYNFVSDAATTCGTASLRTVGPQELFTGQ